jgi:glycine C-acetyltransferase
MNAAFYEHLKTALDDLQNQGLFKPERVIQSPQHSKISLTHYPEVLNLCANNYLSLASDPQIIEAAHRALDQYGYGMASVRFICGTQTIHKVLEERLSDFLGMPDTLLYSSCFDANGGLFETLLGPEDVIISDSLNHASIIDGIRLCKAQRKVYANNNMNALQDCLKQTQACRYRLIATDGVFSMDGIIANLKAICDLAEHYDALVMVDDSHAVGFMGQEGRGTHEYCEVMGRVDIITGTLGKALGGASGGYVSARTPVIEWLRQRSRPYLFSNSLAPVVTATSIAVLDHIQKHPELRTELHRNGQYFRAGLARLGFELIPGEHPIIPVMLKDARLAAAMADLLLKQGIYVIGFSYPVVPHGLARIRTQLSAGFTQAELDKALNAFETVGQTLGVIS